MFEKEKETNDSGNRRKKNEQVQEDEGDGEEVTDEDEGIIKNEYVQEERRDYLDETKKINIPWSASFNINYSLNRSDVNKEIQKIGMSMRANLQLTKNWKIGWNAQADLTTGEVTSQRFDIYRDLHCWEMSFNWQPELGYYGFQINVKSSVLKDIKVTKHPSSSSRYGYGY
jgi:hypothetical protein